jgi:hypothetical protein
VPALKKALTRTSPNACMSAHTVVLDRDDNAALNSARLGRSLQQTRS